MTNDTHRLIDSLNDRINLLETNSKLLNQRLDIEQKLNDIRKDTIGILSERLRLMEKINMIGLIIFSILNICIGIFFMI